MNAVPVSLGGACDVATELLQRRGLATTSHFFDYLWNLDGGLGNVTDIIARQFAGFDSMDNFIRIRHPEWNTPEVSGRLRIACGDLQAEQLCHKHYRNIALLHYQPGTEMVEKFQRKARRFMRLLTGDVPLVFIYYRQYHGPINGQYINQPDYDIDGKLHYWREETERFVRAISGPYPSLEFRVVSCFMAPHVKIDRVNTAVDQFVNELDDTGRISWRQVLRRGGVKSLESWDAIYADLM